MKNKGFTLAEILGVIVVIGLLLILIVPTVINRLNSTKDEAKSAGMNLIYSAADQNIRENANKYPPGRSGRYCIAIQTLIDEGKLVAPVKDVSTGEDISDKSVMVTIYSAGTSDYEIREGDDCEAIASLPMIDFVVTPTGSDWVQKRTAKIIWPKMSGNYRARYRIEKGDWIYVDTVNNEEGGSIEIPFTETAYSKLLEAQYIGQGGETSSNNIIYSRINIVNIDSTPPKCSLKTSGTMGDNSWYTSSVTVSFKSKTDEISGVAKSGIGRTSSYTFGSNSLVQSSDTGGVTYYGFVEDKAGNRNLCSISFKKDGTKPTCGLSSSGSMGNNGWYRSNVTVSMSNRGDNLSGVASVGMSTGGTSYNGSTSMTLSSDSKGTTYYGFIKDKAGNTNSCSKSVKRDVTKPTCTIRDSGSKGNNGWYRGNVTVSLSSSDATSGVASYGVAQGGGALNGSSSVTHSSDTGGVSYGGRVKDNAGNESSCSTSFKKDSTAPTCSSSKGNTWTTAGVTISYSCGDNLSGVAVCPPNKSGVKSSVAAATVKDNAGNTASCPGQSVSPQTQYRTRTRTAATCTRSCCGRYQSGSYACGCAQYRCRYCFIGETQGAGGMCKYTYGSSCAGSLGSDYPLLGKSCTRNKYCAIYSNRTCTDAGCCGYNSWSGWTAWGSGYWCNNATCNSESRILYY